MKVGKYDVTISNIAAYLQGNFRKLVDKYSAGFLELEEHIKEQIIWRETVASPYCMSNKECKCGCPIPDLFYADKACPDKCYPEMMNKEEWEGYKNVNKTSDTKRIEHRENSERSIEDSNN